MFEVRSAFAEKAEKYPSVVVREVELSDEEDSMSTHFPSLIL
jgi:hypothetical protein